MDTSRIIINTIDNSTSYVEQTTPVTGFTVIKAPKGPITPVKILKGGSSKIQDIFGVASEAYPEIFEVETFNKEYDVYVSAPYAAGTKVPVAYMTEDGIFAGYGNIDYTTEVEALINNQGDTATGITDANNVSVLVDVSYAKTARLVNSDTVRDTSKKIEVDSGVSKIPTGLTQADWEALDDSGVTAVVINGNKIELADITPKKYSDGECYIEYTGEVESAYWVKNYETVYCTFIPKYPSERTLHLSFAPFNEFTGYSSNKVESRNKLVVTAYEDGAFHNASHPVSFEGSLNPTDSSSSFTDANSEYAAQSLVYVYVNKPVESLESFNVDLAGYLPVTLAGGVRETEDESADIHEAGWNTVVESGEFDDVDIFFDCEIHTDAEECSSRKFFQLASSSAYNKYCGHIFNLTPDKVDANLPQLGFGREYWNVCNVAVINLPNGSKIFSPMTGAKALMQCRIIENRFGGVAPMWENSGSPALGGQLNGIITPYRLKNKYSKTELDLLDNRNFNPVILDKNYGVMSVGQKTCKTGSITDWNYIGHVCSFFDFLKEVRANVMIPQIGKPNNPYYRELRRDQVWNILRDRLTGSNRIWAEAVVDTSTADGVNDIYAQRARKFVIVCKVRVDTFSEIVELNFYNEDQATVLGTSEE